MKKSFLIALFFACTSSIFSQAFITASNVNLRKSNNSSSVVLKTIPKGASLQVRNCSGGWCETEYANSNGFVSESLLKSPARSLITSNPQAKEPIKYYTNSKKEKVQSPTHYNEAPAGATAICNDGTYSFSRSRRGTCSHHGGVKQWLQ